MDLPTPRFRSSGPAPTADGSVRRARPDDADAIGRIQSEVWDAAYAMGWAEHPERREAMTEIWRNTITDPRTPGHVVLVAVDGDGRVVGFTGFSPLEPPQPGVGEIAILLIGTDDTRHGHGSRLLNAAADHLQDNGFDHIVIWVDREDQVRRTFLLGAGFASDGAQRHLPLTGDGLDQERFVTSLTGRT